MKNTIKVFGVIALVAVIGFSMVSCGGGGGDGDGDGSGKVNWVGTWTMVESANGTKYDPLPSFTLKADKSWTIDNAPMAPKISGPEWEITDFFGTPAIALIDYRGVYDYLTYVIIKSTKIKISGPSFASPSAYGGTYTKE